MKRTLLVLRITAKLLLLALPIVVITGLLTAKPYLLDSESYSTYRRLHTLAVPLAFLPLLYVHSLLGIRMLIRRSKGWNKSWVQWAAGTTWTAVLAALALLFLASPPTGDADPMIDEEPPADGGADGDATATTEGVAALTPVDAPHPAAASGDADADGGVSGDGGGLADAGGPGDAEPPVARPAVKRDPVRPRRVNRPKQPPARAPDASAAAPAQTLPEKTAKQISGSSLVRSRCHKCHGLKTVYAKQRSAAQWRTVITRMQALGVKLTPAERSAVIGHLLRSTKQ